MNPLAARLTSLLLHPDGRRPGTVAEIAEWFGAMQAQDLASVLWSLGVRLPGATLTGVQKELEDRAVLRTWPMRGTVHLVPAADAHWMLELMGVRALAGAAKRRETIGLAADVADRGVQVLGSALAGRRLTRAECLAALAEAGVPVSGPQGYHMLWYAAQNGVAAIAPNVGTEQTFVLLDDWAPTPNRPDREEALGLIAHRFFRSHGPATVADLARWTALTVRDCRTGVAAAGDALEQVTVDGQAMLADPAVRPADAPDTGWLALPGFDEYLLGYKDRSMMLDDAHQQAIIPGGNGVFQATLVRDGRVVGTWKRTLGKTKVTVEARPLVRFAAADRHAAEQALRPYAEFLERPLEVRWPG
ncbi:winged helix DNA-binding domain-containing protein [Mangrovihabitans endophyticus]|uniref:Winged helix DNA-binding domain-containing protein n=1 Tax=Mangrovihabitans endophyticus TaxID=1751298 RepID=A0A8J3C9V9_9ACTN|nr:winged helix DNA-binding domain-containing protein [Mangrovihabitans endophyticus]GGL21095.1 hypothetical protein GCM10012284_64710 [Mangrovihabitans endophyticus]